jgi:hypothetical protein
VSATRIAVAMVLLLVVGLCVLASLGFTAVIAPLVTVFVLLVLIAGGSLLNPRRPG